MTENLRASDPTPEMLREMYDLLSRLAKIDQDPTQLGEFTKEVYTHYPDNPQIFYLAATHLTSLVHLKNESDTAGSELTLPEPTEAMKAFESYTTLHSMLREERQSPRYSKNRLIADRVLTGSREELAFHAVFAYARGQKADLVALPSPIKVDINRSEQDDASDIRIYTLPLGRDSAIEIQVTSNPDPEKRQKYHPRMPVMGLASALGRQKATDLHRVLWQIGEQETLDVKSALPQYQHDLILDAAGSILAKAQTWVDSYENTLALQIDQ